LAPVQVRVATVSDKAVGWGREVNAQLTARGVRVELDDSNDKLGAKIRNAQLAKVPFTLVIGEKEAEARAVAPRRHGGEDLKSMAFDAFLELLGREAAPPY
jgi:threonyl-tRNA synthetase